MSPRRFESCRLRRVFLRPRGYCGAALVTRAPLRPSRCLRAPVVRRFFKKWSSQAKPRKTHRASFSLRRRRLGFLLRVARPVAGAQGPGAPADPARRDPGPCAVCGAPAGGRHARPLCAPARAGGLRAAGAPWRRGFPAGPGPPTTCLLHSVLVRLPAPHCFLGNRIGCKRSELHASR